MPHPQDVAVPSLPEPKLLYCPFCGGAAHCHDYRGGAGYWQVGCQECDATTDGRRIKSDAIEAWNRRAAGRASAEPEGFVLVPRETLNEMLGELARGHEKAATISGSALMDGSKKALRDAPALYSLACDVLIIMGYARFTVQDWLAAAPTTPTASIAPKAEGEADDWVAYVNNDGFLIERETGFPLAEGVRLYMRPQQTENLPEGVDEAMQRLIENAAAMGPASRDDALLVVKHRASLAAPVAQAAPVAGTVCADCNGRRYWRGGFCPACNGTGTQSAAETFRIALHEWAVQGWRDEVQNRPLVNIHRKRLDDFWRKAIRKAGGNPDIIVGPDHDTLVAAQRPSADADRASGVGCERHTIQQGGLPRGSRRTRLIDRQSREVQSQPWHATDEPDGRQ